MPAQPLNHQYQQKLRSVDEVILEFGTIRNLILAMGIAMPESLVRALGRHLPTLHAAPINLYYMHGSEALADVLLQENMRQAVSPHPLFLSNYDREVLRQHPDWVQFVPSTFHQVGRLLTEQIDPDCFMATVSPMDKHGYFSLGTNADYGASVVRKAKRVIVEVNPAMPRTFGECSVHLSEVDWIVESDHPLHLLCNKPITATDEAIATQIAALIEDGDTLQLGVGGVPNAVLSQLYDRQDLGLHSELLSPAMTDLIAAGVINGRRKSWWQHKHIYTLALGDQNMLNFMDDNPSLSGMPASWVNNPSIIRQNDNMVSVNSAIEVDLSGQINAETIAGSPFSGTGGQLDFVRGAYAAKNGRSFIALHSTAKGGTVSKIVPSLSASTVTDTRMDTHFVVTEFGCVNLKGLSLRERAFALAELAHPNFRESLLRSAHLIR